MFDDMIGKKVARIQIDQMLKGFLHRKLTFDML